MRVGIDVETVTAVRVECPYVLDVTFADGSRRRVDVEGVLHGPMFDALRDPARFAEAMVDVELGTVVWPNGADLSPELLYARGGPRNSAAQEPSRRGGEKRARRL